MCVALALSLGGCGVTAVVGATASVVGAAVDVTGSVVSGTVDVVSSGVRGAIDHENLVALLQLLAAELRIFDDGSRERVDG